MYCRCYKTKETTQDLLEKSENAFLTPPFFCDYNSDDSKMSEVLAAIQNTKQSETLLRSLIIYDGFHR